MKLRTSLMAAPTLVSVVLLLCLTGFLLVISAYEQDVRQHVANGQFREAALDKVKRHIGDVHVALYRTVSLVAGLSEDEVKRRRATLPGKAQEVKDLLMQALTDDMQHAAPVEDLNKALGSFVGHADLAIDLATVDPATGVAALQSADDDHTRIVAALAALLNALQAKDAREVADLEHSLTIKEALIAALGLACGVAAFAFSWWMQRRIVGDIQGAVDTADHVAAGQFDLIVGVDRDDEIGQLQAALARMVKELSGSIQTVQIAALSIGQSSREIAVGNQDLSRRTEHTASQLQATASSMEQLTGTVRHTADAARSADTLAQSAADVAKRGGDVMKQVVTNMSEIDQASRKINEIIGVIDGIAFQTNILALNAAVEAARAGEQGKGFAVVAGEVRSLAQRSANAAREIKALIGTSTDRVEVGTRLVQDAGRSMGEIVDGVVRVTQIISEITSAADQESSGIGQVNVAVTELDQMTQQNAALVEQSAAAAESLQAQVGNLSEVVGRFRLAGQR
jgi:methyl-accepting chemotaxis protein